ncbi:MAG: hypothetical protein WC551_07835 [Patescibacteria group bacterium]
MQSKLDAARAAWQHCVDLGVDASAPIEACIKALLECVEEQAQQILSLQAREWRPSEADAHFTADSGVDLDHDGKVITWGARICNRSIKMERK